MGNTTILNDGKLIEIDFATVFQDSVKNSTILKYKSEELKSKILNADSNQLLVVTSTVNSPKEIQSVDKYDDDFLRKTL